MIATLFAIDLGCSVAAVAVYWMTVVASARQGARDWPSARWLGRLAYAAAAAGFVLVLAGLIRSRPHPTGPDEPDVGGARHLLWLLLYGLVLLLAPVQHALAVVAAGASAVRVRSIAHLALNTAAVLGAFVVFPAALVWRVWWALPAVPFGFTVGLRNLLYAGPPSAAPGRWQRDYAVSLMAAGIVLHLALLVLVAAGWPGILPGAWRVV